MKHDPVYRRRLLRSGGLLLAAGLAGCLGRRAGDGTSTSDPSTQTQTPTSTSTEPPMPSATPPGTPVSVPFAFDIGVTNARPSAEQPPMIEFSVTNEGEESHGLTTKSHRFPFTAFRATAGDSALVLLADPGEWEDGREQECWAGANPNWASANGATIPPGSSRTEQYAVVNATENGNIDGPPAECWPATTFAFVEEYMLDAPDPEVWVDGETFRWGFRLRVDEGPSISVSAMPPFRE